MTATERTVCRISLRGPLCAGEAFPLRFFSTRPFWGIPPPPRPLTLASSLRVGPRGGGGLLRKSFATFIIHTTIPYKPSHNPQHMHTRVNTQCQRDPGTCDKTRVHGRCERVCMKNTAVIFISVPIAKAPSSTLVAAPPASTEDGRRICNMKNAQE